jgi:hypothetical protein
MKNIVFPNTRPDVVLITWCQFGDELEFYEQPILAWCLSSDAIADAVNHPIELAIPVLLDATRGEQYAIHDKTLGAVWIRHGTGGQRYSTYEDAKQDITFQAFEN